MSRWRWRDEACEICGIIYEDFRTGYKYNDIFEMLWTGDPDSSKWKYKRRHTVLGLWHQIKKSMWAEHQRECEMAKEYFERLKAKEAAEQASNELAELDDLERHFSDVVYDDEIPF